MKNPASKVSRMRESDDRLPILIWFWGRRGGGARFALELAQRLATNDALRVHLSVARENFLFDRFVDLGLDTHTVSTYSGIVSAILTSLKLPVVQRSLSDYIRSNNIRVVLSAMPHQWTFAMIRAIKKSGARLVSVIHEGEKKKGETLVIPDFSTRMEIAAADHVISLSEFTRQTLITRFRLAPERSSVVDHPCFRHQADLGTRRTYPSGRSFRLLFLGRIREHKGVRGLLEGFERLRRGPRNCELTIVGSGDIEPLRRLIEGTPGIRVVNRWIDESEIPGFMEYADLLVAPYIQASQSGVVPAAYGFGLPVVISPTGGLVEQVEHGKTGIIARDTGPAAIADAVAAIMDDLALYESCSEGALAMARGRMSWESVGDRIAEIILAVARAGAA